MISFESRDVSLERTLMGLEILKMLFRIFLGSLEYMDSMEDIWLGFSMTLTKLGSRTLRVASISLRWSSGRSWMVSCSQMIRKK